MFTLTSRTTSRASLVTFAALALASLAMSTPASAGALVHQAGLVGHVAKLPPLTTQTVGDNIHRKWHPPVLGKGDKPTNPRTGGNGNGWPDTGEDCSAASHCSPF